MDYIKEQLLINLKKDLIKGRLSNYGYEHNCFRNLSNKASKARRALRNAPLIVIEKNLSSGNASRLYVNSAEGELWGKDILQSKEIVPVHYCVGQSWNEEYIRLMETLSRHN